MDSFLLVGMGAIVAGFVQGLSGFGFGLVALSFWAWTLEPKLAATLAVFGALMGQLIAAASVRRGFDVKQLLPFMLGGLLGVPMGVALLPHIDMDAFKALLGTLLVLWCPAMLMARRLPRVTAGGSFADSLVGMAGGAMGGLGGFTGTLPTLWCTLRGFDKDTQRTVIQNFNLSMLLVAMGAHVATGAVTRDTLPYFAVVAPAMLMPSLLGVKLYLNISEVQFRQTILGLLTASGVALLISALPRFLPIASLP